MSAYTYAEHVNSNLICCICRMPFIDPTVTTTCLHTFCKGCILQALSVVPQCPVDRLPLKKEELESANPIIRHLVDELVVECPMRHLGCTHTCQRQFLATHLREECSFIRVKCKMDECASSTHQEECPEEEVECSDCESIFPRNELWSHLSECPNKVVNCQHSEYGCSWSGYRHNLVSTHLPQCVYEALKGFLALNSSRVASLETENGMLRERIEGLENRLQSARQDLQIAKSVLGPWFRSDNTQGPPRPSPPIEPPPRSYPRPQSNNFNGPLYGSEPGPSGESAGPPLRATPDATTPSDPLAPYFPPEIPSGSNDDSIGQAFDSVYPHIPQNSHVAPLNLNTTLEGSLGSLCNSIVTLAATLDSEVRRHDAALATEILRVNEDLMALRAVVHGFRMQVHQIMMDRNSQFSHGEDDESSGMKIYHTRSNSVAEPWTVPVRYLNHYPPVPRPISLSHIQTTKL
ncbi:hypothetical protein M422DRAFT_161130 [Sphaerobolus stellatus SS14]|nr:hypothetical protein M422DRAFT_161130 [Sphaerobolus stellatus SS14]